MKKAVFGCPDSSVGKSMDVQFLSPCAVENPRPFALEACEMISFVKSGPWKFIPCTIRTCVRTYVVRIAQYTCFML